MCSLDNLTSIFLHSEPLLGLDQYAFPYLLLKCYYSLELRVLFCLHLPPGSFPVEVVKVR